jgi:hypothetical protein
MVGAKRGKKETNELVRENLNGKIFYMMVATSIEFY